MIGLSIQKRWLKLSGYGALWLTAATLLTKLIGVLQKIPLQNLAGDVVFGIYNVVYPIYQLMMALAIAGIPTALATYIALLRPDERQRTFQAALYMSGAAALLLAIAAYWSAPLIGRWIGHEEIVSSLRVLAAALLFTPLVAVYRGYYQGIEDARSSSWSQLLEQLVRVACMVLALIFGLAQHWSEGVLAAAVMWGSAVGAIAALFWLWLRKPKAAAKTDYPFIQIVAESRRLFTMALPAALAAIVVPIVAVVDAFSIPRLLETAGMQASDVMAQYGIYSRIQPLIQLVSMILAAFAAGFLPRWIKQNQDQREKVLLGKRLLLLHRLAWMAGCGAAVGLYMLAEPINMMLYKDAVGIETFRWLSLSTLMSCVLAMQAPLLQGAGLSRLPIWLLIIAAGGKAVLNSWLVPIYGITGAAIAANLSLLVPASIGAVALYAVVKRDLKGPEKMSNFLLLRSIVPSVFAGGVMALALYILELLWLQADMGRMEMTLYTLIAVLVGALVYSLTVWTVRGVTKQELTWLG